MKKTTKLLLAALAVCVLAAAVAAASLSVTAANEKTGMFNGSLADVDEAGNLLLNSTNFPDEKFRTYVSDFDKDGDNKLSVDEVAKVERIDIIGTKDLTGICYFTSLTELDCSSNMLSELDVSNCPKLAKLDCSDNRQYELDGSINKLSKLDVSNCPELRSLRCYENDLTELDIRICTKLEMLDCSNNSLSELDLSKCLVITEINCGENNISELDLSKCTKLETLNCFNNSLSELDLSKCTGLTELNCSYNNLSELDLDKCTELTSIICSNNKITKLNINEKADIHSLHCSYNKLSSLDVSGFKELTELYCINNGISVLDVSKCTKLTELDCSLNELSELDVSNCPELCDLSCVGNELTELDVSKCTKLYNLLCEKNLITTIDLSNCPDIFCARLGEYVMSDDLDLSANHDLRIVSFGIESYFDSEKNVWKTDYAEYLDIINNYLSPTNEAVMPFSNKTIHYRKPDGKTGAELFCSWYVDNDGVDKNEYSNDWDGFGFNEYYFEFGYPYGGSLYDPDADKTYYWTKYENGCLIGADLNEHPELADYYKNETSFIGFDIYGWGVGGLTAEEEFLELTVYITPEPVLSDSDTNVTAEYPAGEHDDYSGVIFNAEKLTEGDDYKAAEKAVGEDYTGFIPYSFTLTDKDGKPVSVKSSMTVKVPVPEGWEAGKTLVFYVDGDGKVTDMNAAPSEDGKSVTFSTTHFSTYVLVNAATKKDAPTTDAPTTDAPATDAPATDAPATNRPGSVPPTGDTSPVVPAAVTLVLSAAACISIIVKRRKDDDK